MRCAGGAMTGTGGFSRELALRVFEGYISRFDASDPKVALKLEHMYRVAELCDEIARSEGLHGGDADLA